MRLEKKIKFISLICIIVSLIGCKEMSSNSIDIKSNLKIGYNAKVLEEVNLNNENEIRVKTNDNSKSDINLLPSADADKQVFLLPLK